MLPRRTLIAVVIAGLVIAGGSAGLTAFAIDGGSGTTGMAMDSGASAPPSGTPTPLPSVDTAGFPTGSGIGIFTDRCLKTTTAANDPILMPGMAGHSMQHDFYGNTGTTASSTTAQLLGGSTECSTSADASAYWTPVLYQSGKPVEPSGALIYWRALGSGGSTTKAIPTGLTMIAGNEASDTPQGVQTIGWTCSGGAVANMKLAASPHDCAAGSDLRLVVTFPNCWDGSTLNGAKQQNVVYATGSRSAAVCPTSHPIRIPQIVFHVNYPTSSAAGLTLSIGPTTQGSITTEHTDFMNGWSEPVMTADTSACIATATRCGPVTGSDATPQGGVAITRRTRQAQSGSSAGG